MPLTALVPLAGGITVLLLIFVAPRYVPARWRKRWPQESPWAFGAVFGVAPVVYGFGKLFTDGFAGPIKAAMVAALLAAAGVAVHAVLLRKWREFADVALIVVLALPLGLGFGSIYTTIDAMPDPLPTVAAGDTTCTVEITNFKKDKPEDDTSRAYDLRLKVTAADGTTTRRRLTTDLDPARLARLKAKKRRYECRGNSDDRRSLEIQWDKPIRTAPGAAGEAGTAAPKAGKA